MDAFAPESDAALWSETFEGAGFPSHVERNMEREPLISFNHLDERGEDYYANPNIDFTIPLLAYTEAEETNIIARGGLRSCLCLGAAVAEVFAV